MAGAQRIVQGSAGCTPTMRAAVAVGLSRVARAGLDGWVIAAANMRWEGEGFM